MDLPSPPITIHHRFSKNPPPPSVCPPTFTLATPKQHQPHCNIYNHSTPRSLRNPCAPMSTTSFCNNGELPEEMELLNLKIRAWKSTKEPCHIKHVTWAHCNPLQRPCSIQTREINARLVSNVQQTKQSKGILSADKKNKNIFPLCAQPECNPFATRSNVVGPNAIAEYGWDDARVVASRVIHRVRFLSFSSIDPNPPQKK